MSKDYTKQAKDKHKERIKKNKEIWDFNINDTSINEFDKLILKIVYLTRNIHENDLINILRPALLSGSIKKALKLLERERYIYKKEFGVGIVYALDIKGTKLLNFNTNIKNPPKCKITPKQLVLHRCLYGDLAEKILKVFGNKYYKIFNEGTANFQNSYIIDEYIKGKVYFEYLSQKKDRIARYNILVSLGIPLNIADEFSYKKDGKYLKIELLKLFKGKTDCRKLVDEMKMNNAFKKFREAISTSGIERFELLYNIDKEKLKSRNSNLTTEIETIVENFKEAKNNFLYHSNHLSREAIYKNLNEPNEYLILEKRMRLESNYVATLNTLARNFKKSKSANSIETQVIITDIEATLESSNRYIEEHKVEYRIPTRKKEDDKIIYVSPTFNYLRSKGIYISRVKGFNIEVAIIDNTQNGIEPTLLFDRIDLALETFRMIHSRLNLTYKVICHNEFRESKIKNKQYFNNLQYHFDKYNDEGFAGIMDKIYITSITENDRLETLKEYYNTLRKEEI